MSHLTRLRDDEPRCDTGRTCPQISSTSRGTLVVQGYFPVGPEATARLGKVPEGEIAIEVPLSLLPELAGGQHSDGPYVISGDVAVFHGPPVTDPAILAELSVPSSEAVIELPAVSLPFLEVAGHA